MAVEIVLEGKFYEWSVTEKEAREILEKHGVKQEIIIKSKQIMKEFSAVDPYTVGLLIGGGLAALGTYIWYRLTQKQMAEFKSSVIIKS